MAKEFEKWVTINGRHVPIYKDDPESARVLQIENRKNQTAKFTAQKNADNLLVAAKKFKYTHDDLKPLWSRAQIFPIYNESVTLLDKIDRVLKKLDKDDPRRKELSAERARLLRQHNILLEGHKDRVVKEVQGSRVFMNDDYYHREGF